MTKVFPGPKPGEPASLVLLAALRTLRRHASALAIKSWNSAKRFSQPTLLTASFAVLLPAAAQARTYQVLTVDVPFKFTVGNRTFRPGHYQFIPVGAGLLALRDARARVIASFVTRSIEIGGPAPATKLVFNTQKKPARLTQIWLENRFQVLEVLEEELALRQSFPTPTLPTEFNFLLERRESPGLKH